MIQFDLITDPKTILNERIDIFKFARLIILNRLIYSNTNVSYCPIKSVFQAPEDENWPIPACRYTNSFDNDPYFELIDRLREVEPRLKRAHSSSLFYHNNMCDRQLTMSIKNRNGLSLYNVCVCIFVWCMHVCARACASVCVYVYVCLCACVLPRCMYVCVCY